MPKRVYPNAKERILDAAEEVLVEGGPHVLSVEAVVNRAGMSKGGFFYHFPTKDDLLQGMTERIIGQHMAQIEEIAQRDPEPRGRMLRSFLKFAFQLDQTDRFRRLMWGFLALAGSSPGVQGFIQQLHEQIPDRAQEDSLPFDQYLLVHLAMDGLWMGSALGTRRLTAEQSRSLEKLLLKLAAQPLE